MKFVFTIALAIFSVSSFAAIGSCDTTNRVNTAKYCTQYSSEEAEILEDYKIDCPTAEASTPSDEETI
ncbi:MAG: hypothetical protein Q7U04_12520 [Bacteriovorax sp.]|nr:hypothetical protein [Bacteriovorax sp.]